MRYNYVLENFFASWKISTVLYKTIDKNNIMVMIATKDR